jgi:hypothetical protein
MTPAMLIGLLYYIRPQRAWLARPAAFATSVVQPR